MNDPRIGTYNADGSYATYPEQDVTGLPSERPPAMLIRLDANHFVVTPDRFEDMQKIDELRRLVSAPVRKATPTE